MIRFVCQHCQQAVRVADSFGGKKGRCPHCKGLVQIPVAGQAQAQTLRSDGLEALIATGPALQASDPPASEADALAVAAAPPEAVQQAAAAPDDNEPRAELDAPSQAEQFPALADTSEDQTIQEAEPADLPPSSPPEQGVEQPAGAGKAAARKLPKPVVIGAIAGAIVIGLGVVLLVTKPWKGLGPEVPNMNEKVVTAEQAMAIDAQKAARAAKPATLAAKVDPPAAAPPVLPADPPVRQPVVATSKPVEQPVQPPETVEPPKTTEAPKPVPATKPAAAAAKVNVICTNAQCPTKGAVFTMDDTGLTPDMLAGNDAITCPKCNKVTAVLAVKCPKCGKLYPQTMDCPTCSKAAAPK